MILVVGLSHHTAAISIREQVALAEADVDAFVASFFRRDEVSEAFVVSTCNRVEVVLATARDDAHTLLLCKNAVKAAFIARSADAEPALYFHEGSDAVRHVVRVASSLDSLVVGEAQILGQLKQGFDRAIGNATVGPTLHQLYARAARGAKRVRTETTIGSGQVSVPSIAIALAGQIFGELRGRKAVLVGAGEMGQTVARLLSDAGAELRVVGRSLERVAQVAEKMGGTSHHLDSLVDLLVDADVVVCSTSAPGHVL